MTPEQRAALDAVVARTGHRRYLDLCDEAHPDYHPGCPGLMVELAGAAPAPGPGLLRKAANFTRAVVSHVTAGLPILDEAATAARLAVCATCPARRDGSCTLCGCNLAVKASWRDQDCPRGLWPGADSVS